MEIKINVINVKFFNGLVLGKIALKDLKDDMAPRYIISFLHDYGLEIHDVSLHRRWEWVYIVTYTTFYTGINYSLGRVLDRIDAGAYTPAVPSIDGCITPVQKKSLMQALLAEYGYKAVKMLEDETDLFSRAFLDAMYECSAKEVLSIPTAERIFSIFKLLKTRRKYYKTYIDDVE